MARAGQQSDCEGPREVLQSHARPPPSDPLISEPRHMSVIATEVLIILCLLVVNGVFAMSELAIVTARKVRLEQRADDGDAGARAALELAREPTKFLSTVQVGITLIGVLAGAFGGATIAEELAIMFKAVPLLAEHAEGIALGVVVASITYLSLLIGELVPKRVALSHPERVAALIARPMRLLARVASPLVVLLTGPTNLALRLFGIRVSAEPSITAEEIRALIEQGAESGVVEDSEHEMVEGVFRLGDRVAADLMTPRTRLEWIDISQPPDEVRTQMAKRIRARYLVCDERIDNVVGVAYAEDILARCFAGESLDLRGSLRQPLYVPASMPAPALLEQFRRTRQHVAVALDEYGGIQGVVMLDDLVEAVLGEMPAADETIAPAIERRDIHTWVMRGSVAIEDLELTLDIAELPDEKRRGVRTLGGLIMTQLGRVPTQGERVEWNGLGFTIAAMDGRRIESVVVSKGPASGAGGKGERGKDAHPS